MSNFIVVRLVPESPVDGGTFSTYLDDLRLQVFDAYTGAPLSGFVYSSPYVLTQAGGIFGSNWISAVSLTTSAPTQYVSANNYGNTLTFDSTDGIPEGSGVFSEDGTTIAPSANLTVSQVTGTTVQLSGTLTNYVPAGTVVTFIAQSQSGDPNAAAPFSFNLNSTNTQTVDGQGVLTFADASGVNVGMQVASGVYFAAGTVVAEVDLSTNTVTLSANFATTPPAAIPVIFTQNPPFANFSLTPLSGTPAAHPTKLKFSNTTGIAVGMTIEPIPGLVDPGTVVTNVTSSIVTISKQLTSSLPGGQALTFIFPLSSGIAQHTEVIGTGGFFGLQAILGPASVATAVIPLFAAPPPKGYLDITIKATRGTELIPINTRYYNVLVENAALPTAGQYQSIPSSETSLYLALPPPVTTNTISLIIPSDGTAPQFDALYQAMNTALTNDPISSTPTIASLISSPASCSRIAYDIVWSYQNTLPAPPDALESLYTNPPNPGGSADNSNNSTNNLEQDRQKFEGTLNSFYSTRNAQAERLTKFVAAASAAVVCEQASLNSGTALLVFPVDPSSSFATEVESEILLQGVEANGSGGVNFGVPAAYFYALGANLDKSTSAQRRFQQATGDDIERLLQQFATAEDAKIVSDQDLESFVTPQFSSVSITSFQAARRLSALGISAASTSPAVTLVAGTPLAQLVADWLAATDPTPNPAPNPPLIYLNTDFLVWTHSLAAKDPQGYLSLDLDALTKGYVIPSFTASPTSSTATTLTFSALNPDGTLLGIGAGMPITGPDVAAGTTISQAIATTTVTLSAALLAGGVKPADVITFGAGSSQITASPNAIIASGNQLTFAGGLNISAGMAVTGPNIAAGTTVNLSQAVTTATLSQALTGPVTSTDVFTFNASVPTTIATTSADCPSGAVLTFAGAATTSGIEPGMTAFGLNIAPDSTVTQATTVTTVTLSAALLAGGVKPTDTITFGSGSSQVTASTNVAIASGAGLTFTGGLAISVGMTVSGPNIPGGATVSGVTLPGATLSKNILGAIPAGSVIEFASFPPASLLADQIAQWLPSTTTPPTPNPTIETLKQVTAPQWTIFFTTVGNPTWLPPFTQPVAPGAAQSQATQKAGYVALRIRTFVRAVQEFFTVSSLPTTAQLPKPGAPETFDLPAFDPIAQAVAALPAGFKFGTAITAPNLSAAVTTVFPTDLGAQDWLAEAITAINEMWWVASVVQNPTISGYTLPNPVSLAFSVAEALYARGFRRAIQISNLPASDFQQALIGTVAYDFALSNTGGNPSLYQQAQTIAPPTSTPGQTGGSFQPINPDGSLVDCVPPPCLSPLGPIAYLQEMLKLSQASTCDDPWAAPAAKGDLTLGDAVAARRGNVGSLLADCANLETPLPTIDMVNECLEYLGATQPSSTQTPGGTIYNTSADELAGYKLCQEDDCPSEKKADCHKPEAILATLPEYSTPATPVTGVNDSVVPLVWDDVKTDFSACCLPYSQELDVSRTYLRHMGSCRFEELRTFRKCITEFALNPNNPPSGFQSFLWRYPVRIDTAIEYLGISPDEYSTVFQGATWQPCGPVDDRNNGSIRNNSAQQISLAESYGYPASSDDQSWMEQVVVLSEFLKRTCLTYCEFLELWKAILSISSTGRDSQQKSPSYPECEPCCLKDYRLQIPGDSTPDVVLLQLAVFIRLWRKLKEVCGACYTFAELIDICTVLDWFNGTTLNPDFIRQLAAFQMLRDHFKLPLVDHADVSSGSTGADRTHLLALWKGSGAKKWNWAIHQLLVGVQKHAKSRFGCVPRRDEEIAFMAGNLDNLSRLAGFNPPTSTNPSTDTWNNNPSCTLRFAELLAKISASQFRPGELLYLFNATSPHEHEDPFAQNAEDALNHPIDLPEESEEHSLWRLRKKLLEAEVGDDECHRWTWPRVVDEFHDNFGYAAPGGQDPLLSIGQHFFPDVLEDAGYAVQEEQRQYRVPLASSAAWNTPPGGPFQYDSGSTQLWLQLPLRDEAVASKLAELSPLNHAEQVAVQDLYFAPRVDLAFLAFLFPDWQSAERHLIYERDERERWAYFRRHFALAVARRRIIVKHLAKHVAHRSGDRLEYLELLAGIALSNLLSDENTGTPWEADSGAPPSVMWSPSPSGGAIAALLGLAGTGLLGEYEAALPQNDAKAPAAAGTTYKDIWREVRGPMEAFGEEHDHTNSPVLTIVPALDASPSASSSATFNNGYAIRNSDGRKLGGVDPIRVKWSGVLLVDHEGEYRFHAGAPAPEEEEPSVERARASQWRVTLTRGSRTWLALNHQWPGETGSEKCMLRLRRGAYAIVIEYNQPAPDFSSPHLHPQHTGFQVKYRGPDTCDCLVTLPVRHLYRDFQDQTLDQGITFLPGSKNAQAFLKAFYTSTLRDMRRTYQRAFKATLFASRLGLSAHRDEDCDESELGYMLANADLFAGHAYYRTSSTAFAQHLCDFNFNFLPLIDSYHAPTATAGDRSDPSLQRTQAMFDWWERIFDYERMRREVHRVHKGHLWHLFDEAQEEHPTDPADLLRYIGAPSIERNLELRFFQDQYSPIYSVTSSDLQDERWLIRVWHANRWLHRLAKHFHIKNISKARPDLWAATYPSASVPASGTTQTGNANLLAFIADGCLDCGEPRHYVELAQLNDGLRDRGRRALIAYLCSMNRVSLPWSTSTYATTSRDLSDLLLLDVDTGTCEKASRIEEAISAVQTFVRRSRIGLEPNWKVDREFARLWDSRFDTFRTWQRCKRREFYKENWIEWAEFGRARRIEAFRFLETQLKSATLTMAAPGGLDWWADDTKALEHEPELIQRAVPSELYALTAPPQSTTREGLGTLGSPESASEQSWLAAIPQQATLGGGGGQSGNNQTPPRPSATSPGAAPASAPALVRAAVVASAQPQNLPFWMESAVKMGTKFLRIAAAGVPEAALRFEPQHGDEHNKGCCRECGKKHSVLVDEYYFWTVSTKIYTYTDDTDAQSNPQVSFSGSYQFGFQDSYYDRYQQQSAEWNDEDQVPALLAKWEPQFAVRLAWCKVHNGEFGQPRKSEGYVAIDDPGDLVFLGRAADSLYFQVSGSSALPPGFGGTGGDTSPPGFRYDLACDETVALPEVLKPPAPPTPSPYPAPLLSYPFFAYDEPGARLFPASWFAPALLVGNALRCNCHFELALKWYQRAFNPLEQDCAWMHCNSQATEPTSDQIAKEAYQIWVQHGRPPAEQNQDWFEARATLKASESTGGSAPEQGPPQGACCNSAMVTEDAVRSRAIVLQWCQTVLDWGDAIMRRRRSPEGFEQARTLYDAVARVTGPHPRVVRMPEPGATPSVSNFAPAFPSLNPRLMDLFDRLRDRLELVHHCIDARRLKNGRLGDDMCYFGDNPLRDGWRTVPESCAELGNWCHWHSPYRFVAQIPKAIEWAAKVREFGNALIGAYKDGDAERIAAIRAEQERELLALGVAIRQDQWRDADWQIQALQQTKDVNQTNLLYYSNLFQNGLINDEIQNLSLSTNAMQTRTSANVTEAIGEALKVIPDFFVGAMSTFSQVPIGTKLAGLFETIGKVMLTVAEIQSATAAIDMTQSTWQRRSDEWFHQMQVLPIEIQQTELQILGAQRRRDQALRELNNQQRQVEHSAEILDFLRDKFTATEQFDFLRRETQELHARMFKLAHHAALEAQRAFNFERGHTTRCFIPDNIWDDVHQGLMAGERLESALHHMEKAYLDENVREYELTKHFSLRLHFPMEFLRLKATGHCEIELPEWMYDLDYPGHYMRRFKSLSLTIPCVTSPYTGVHCRVTLLSSKTRIDPRLETPSTGCCCECGSDEGYEACLHDPRIVNMYGATEAIATSSGQNDSGLFELNFRDERYLPFEFQGAVCRLRIELPPENNYFPMEPLTDVILHVNHTAREGGEMLRRAAARRAQKHLPGSGWCFFDVRHEFPDAWELLQDSALEDDAKSQLALSLERRMFPYVPAAGELSITGMAILFEMEAAHDECNCREVGECPCPHECDTARRVVGFKQCSRNGEDELKISCLELESSPGLFFGIFETKIGPLNEDKQQAAVQFRFPARTGELERVYLLCRYERRRYNCKFSEPEDCVQYNARDRQNW